MPRSVSEHRVACVFFHIFTLSQLGLVDKLLVSAAIVFVGLHPSSSIKSLFDLRITSSTAKVIPS